MFPHMIRIIFSIFFLLPVLLFAEVNSHLEQGARFAAAGNFDKALGEYRSVLADDPKNAKAYFGAAEARYKMKDYSGAIANYRLAYRWNPDMISAYEGAAKAFEALGDKASAAEERKKIPQLPDFAEPVESTPKEETKQKKNAEDSISKTNKTKEVETNSKTKAAKGKQFSYDGDLFKKGRELFNAKKYDAAAAIWREVLASEPGNPGAYYFAGVGRYEAGEIDKAEYNLQRAFDYPELGYNAHYYLSLIYKKQEKGDLEKQELEKYISLSSNASAVAKAKARIKVLSKESKSLGISSSVQQVKSSSSVAIPLSKASADKAPVETEVADSSAAEDSVQVEKKTETVQNTTTKDSSLIAFGLANGAMKQGDLNKALALYKTLLEGSISEDQRSFTLLQMGHIYRLRRDWRSAVSRYREIVETYPNSEWATEAQRSWEDAVWQEKNAEQLPRN